VRSFTPMPKERACGPCPHCSRCCSSVDGARACASLGEASPSARGLEPQQVQRWLQYYLRAVLCGLPLGILLHLDSPVSRGLESILAACFAGALYPLARAAQSRPSQAVFACGLMTAATGVGLSLFGWLSSFQAIVWMALSGLLWQGLRSASRPTAPVE
jgi:hypothetical protein